MYVSSLEPLVVEFNSYQLIAYATVLYQAVQEYIVDTCTLDSVVIFPAGLL